MPDDADQKPSGPPLGEAVRERREALQQTTVAFAQTAAISRQTLHAIENEASRPTSRVLARIDAACNWLAGTARELLDGRHDLWRQAPPVTADTHTLAPRRRLLALASSLPEPDVVEVLGFIDQRHNDIDDELARVRRELAELRQLLSTPRPPSTRTRSTDARRGDRAATS